MRIELFSRKRLLKRPLWYFRIRAANGELIAQSEGYSRKIDALGTANLLKNGAAGADIVGMRDSGDVR
jgi:uncharacterized protein YegP (UPF0339 family)